jgi:redox-sensitive transcriptional activator SoxR
MEPTFTIQQVSRRSGVAASALRYYEQLGLIRSERAGSGHRRFVRSTLRRIAFIVFAQRVGLSLKEIGEELARLPSDRVPTGPDWSSSQAAGPPASISRWTIWRGSRPASRTASAAGACPWRRASW